LGDDGKHFGSTLLEHVEHALDSEEAVGVLFLTDTLEEDGQVVMVVKLHNVDLPLDLILRAVLNGDGQVTTVVETAEFTGHNGAALDSTSLWGLGHGNFLGLVEGGGLATATLALLESGLALAGDRLLGGGDVGNGHEGFFTLGHVVLGEVTEAGVLGLGEQLVLGEFPGLTVSLGDHLLQVVLSDHRRGVVDLRHGEGLNVTHFVVIEFGVFSALEKNEIAL